jgi:hypothetical protein
MPAGPEREEMLMKAQRAEMAAQFDEWASQPDSKKEKCTIFLRPKANLQF